MGSVIVYEKIKMQKMYVWKDYSKVLKLFFFGLDINLYLLMWRYVSIVTEDAELWFRKNDHILSTLKSLSSISSKAEYKVL